MSRTCKTLIYASFSLLACLLCCGNTFAQVTFTSVTPRVVLPGSALLVTLSGTALEATSLDFIYNSAPSNAGRIEKLNVSEDKKTLTIRLTLSQNAQPGTYFIQAAVAGQTYEQPITVGIRSGEQARSIVGFEQAGASAAPFDQKFFFDFYISRPLPKIGPLHEPWLRWWGNVRVASVPQQISTPVATFVNSFADTIGKLPVNQLAESAEFVSGIEVPIVGQSGFISQSEDSKQRFSFGIFAGGGATGTPQPKSTLQVFQVPDATSAQYLRFASQFPGAVGRKYIGFLSPDRDQFLRQYFAGVRLTTYYQSMDGVPYISPPAIVAASFGQNELVTGGSMRGLVTRIEAFYPLPLVDRGSKMSSIYLFGSVQMRLKKANPTFPFILQEAVMRDSDGKPVLDSSQKPIPIPGYDKDVFLVTTPSNRDIYKIGVGIDVLRLFTHTP